MRPTMGARRKMATADSTAASTHTSVETRATGMPSSEARSPFSAAARTAMPMSVKRKKAPRPAQMRTVATIATTKFPS